MEHKSKPSDEQGATEARPEDARQFLTGLFADLEDEGALVSLGVLKDPAPRYRNGWLSRGDYDDRFRDN
jgi:hypothetical protein